MHQLVVKVHCHSLEGHHYTGAQVSPCFLAPSQDLCSKVQASRLRWYLWVLEMRVGEVSSDGLKCHKEMGSIGCRYAEGLGLHHSWNYDCHPQECSYVAVVAVQVKGNHNGQ